MNVNLKVTTYLTQCHINQAITVIIVIIKDAPTPIPVLGIVTDTGAEYSTRVRKIHADTTTLIPVLCVLERHAEESYSNKRTSVRKIVKKKKIRVNL